MANTDQQNIDIVIENIFGTEIEAVLHSESYLKAANKLPQNAYELAADRKNEDKLIEAILKTLKKSDPENATYKQALIIAKQVQLLSRHRLNEIRKHTALKK